MKKKSILIPVTLLTLVVISACNTNQSSLLPTTPQTSSTTAKPSTPNPSTPEETTSSSSQESTTTPPSSSSTSSSISSSTESSSSSSSMDKVIVDYGLDVTSLPTKNRYSQYETLSLEGLVISLVGLNAEGEIVTAEETSSYTLTLNGKPLEDGLFLSETGRKTVVVTSTDMEHPDLETTFTILVYPNTSLKQDLTLTGKMKTFYQVGESLDFSGLSFSMETIRVDSTGKQWELSTALYQDDLEITIDGKDIDGFTFSSSGRYTLDFKAQGYEEVLEASLLVYCLVEDSVSPEGNLPMPTLMPDKETMEVTITRDGLQQEEDDKGYYSPEEVVVDYGIYEYGFNAYDSWVYAPSHPLEGESVHTTPFLVVPVVFEGGEEDATEENRDLIKKAFFSDGQDMEYESLHSFYSKSSFGLLNITGSVTDFFYVDDYGDVGNTNVVSPGMLNRLTTNIASWAEEVYGLDLTEYDSDKDGTIDGIWMVYIGKGSNPENFWGLSGTTGYKGTIENPVANNYGLIGMDFIGGSYDEGMDKGGDAHVVIHETGHMLGLMDYYAYNEEDIDYSPLGGIDVMDGGITDHNSYSKLLYGWTKPYIVYGNATLSIPSAQQEDALIILPYDGKTYRKDEDGLVHFNPFDEYLVLDYYTYQNLNTKGYDYAGDYPLESDGARLYHVDARLTYKDGNEYVLFEDPDDALSYDGLVAKLITNTSDGSYAESSSNLLNANAFDEIRWISADNTYLNHSNKRPTNATLFQEGDTFSLENYKTQFNGGTFNSKKGFSASIHFDAIG